MNFQREYLQQFADMAGVPLGDVYDAIEKLWYTAYMHFPGTVFYRNGRQDVINRFTWWDAKKILTDLITYKYPRGNKHHTRLKCALAVLKRHHDKDDHEFFAVYPFLVECIERETELVEAYESKKPKVQWEPITNEGKDD